MAITIKQIAEYAGTSRGTVDKVIHNRPGVKESTRQHVQAILDELDYHPNIVAKALVMKDRIIRIGVIVTPDYNNYIQQVISGTKDAAKEFAPFGISVTVKALSSYEPAEQISLLDTLVAEGCQGIAVFPMEDKALIEKVNQLYDEGIMIITYNSRAEGMHALTHIGQDNRKAGRTAGSLIGRIVPSNSHIAVIISSRNITGHALRLGGFREKLSIDYPTLDIVDIMECFDDSNRSYLATKQICTKHPDISAIYLTGGGSFGVCNALRELNMDNSVKVICHDISPRSEEFLRSGIISFSIEQDGHEQGYQLVKILFDCLVKRESIKPLVLAPVMIVNEELLH